MDQLISVVVLVSLAVLHSALGEWLLLGPLVAHADWPSLSIGRRLGRRTLRFAWHLTSLAWLGLAAILCTEAEQAPLIASAVLGASGVVAFAASRGQHFSWALFGAGALGALSSADLLSSSSIIVMGVGASLTLLLLGLMHLGWAFGLRWGVAQVVPTKDGREVLQPRSLVTIAVALALLAGALLALGLVFSGALFPLARPLGLLASVVFALRVLGDGRYVGLFKRVRGSRFSFYDDVLFTPLCFALSACFLFAANLEAL